MDEVPTRYWQRLDDGRIQCDLCPRFCKLREGQRGLCFVRACRDERIVLTTYGRSSGFCVDPIEKKPLNHFLPGHAGALVRHGGLQPGLSLLSELGHQQVARDRHLADRASPETIANAAASRSNCRSVAFTYNDPVIFHEYAVDVAEACRERGIRSVAVTAGEICEEPRREFFRHMDAANVDLKAFTDRFYHRICAGHLQPVLDTLVYLKHETDVWFEITT